MLQQDSPDESDDGLFIGKDTYHVSLSFDFLIQPFQMIGAVQLYEMLRGKDM